MIQRVLNLTAAIAAVAAAVAVVIVAASYGVFAAARVWLTPAASAAVVAGIFAVVAIVVALIATGKFRPQQVKAALAPPPSPIEQAILLAKQRPIMAAGVGVVAAFIAIRNPALLTTAVSAFMAGKAEQPPKPKK